MADTLTTQSSTPATIPASTVIATDDAGAGGHVQIVKLAVSTDGSATPLTADNTDGLLVNLGANNDITGTVTANAGTNLNTSALLTEADFDTKTGGTNETAPVSDTAASGLNGRLQRIAQRITSLIALIPAALTGSGNFKVSLEESNATQAVSGTVTATLPSGDNTIGRTKITDGTTVATVRDLAANDALNVAIVDGSGNQVTSFGGSGGTSATDDAAFTAASGSGTPMMGFVTADPVDSGDVGVVGMDANRNLKVSIEADNVGIGGGTQYTEDAAAAANPVGNALIMVRDDVLSGQTTTDGDNVAVRGTDKGEMYVKHVDAIPVTDNSGSLTVDNAGTFAVQVDAALPAGTNAIGKLAANDGVDIGDVTINNSSIAVTDNAGSLTVDNTNLDNLHNADFDTGAGTDTTPAIGIAVPASGGAAVITGDATNGLDVDVTRVSGTVTVDGSGVTQPVSGTVTANLSATDNAVLDNIDADTSAIQTAVELIDDTVATDGSAAPTKGILIAGQDGTNAQTIKTDTNGELQVDILSSALPSGAATAANQSTANTALSAIQTAVETIDNAIGGTEMQVDVVAALPAGDNNIGNVDIVSGTVTTVTTLTGGGVAHDSADSGNPVKVGAKASLTLSDDTVVANGDRTDLTSDADGALYVRNVPLGDLITEAVSDTGGTSTAFTNFGATASARNYITAITAFRTDSGTSMAYIDIRDGTAGSVLYRIPLPPAGGVTLNNGGAPLLYSSANTALAYDVSSALTTVYISVTGFKSKARA